MANGDELDVEEARSRLLRLLEADEWELSNSAREKGQTALRFVHGRTPTDWEMVEYVISLLQGDDVLRCAPQGNPPGSTGIAWQLTDSRNVFVKLRIKGSFGREKAYIQSLHESVHRK